MQPSTATTLLLPLLFHFTPLALAIPQAPSSSASAAPAYNPGYSTATPIDEMELAVFAAEAPYPRNSSDPCSGFVALNASRPLPSGLSNCIAGISKAEIASAPAVHNMTCVTETKKDARLEKCDIVGYLDNACGTAPILTQRRADGWAFQTAGDVQSFQVNCSSAQAGAA